MPWPEIDTASGGTPWSTSVSIIERAAEYPSNEATSTGSRVHALHIHRRGACSPDEGHPAALLDEDGPAVVVHGGPDDDAIPPAGAAGARVLCGVV